MYNTVIDDHLFTKMRKTYFLTIFLCLSFSLLGGPLPKDKEAKIIKVFPEADIDKSGDLSIKEIEQVLPELPEKYQEVLTKFLKKVKAKSIPISSNRNKDTKSNISIADFKYGEHERQAFDLYLSESETATPLVVFIHGGGFKKGDKSSFQNNSTLLELLKKGISCASINYRFCYENEAGLLGCLMDSKLALQTLRYHSKKWNIDKDRVVLYGGSAGAGTSLWLGFRDEMADASSENPIERESTRVKGMIAKGVQATYHFERWPEVLKSEKKSASTEAMLMYAKPEEALGKLKATHSIQRELDMLAWLSVDDPAVYVVNGQKDSVINLADPKHRGLSLHHPLHAKALADRAKETGLKNHYIFAKGIDLKSNEEIQILDFILKFI